MKKLSAPPVSFAPSRSLAGTPIPYAGSPRRTKVATTIADGSPLGPRAVAFLRRVRAVRGPYRMALNADREAVKRAIAGGFVTRDCKDRDTVYLTEAGAAYLDRLMRVE